MRTRNGIEVIVARDIRIRGSRVYLRKHTDGKVYEAVVTWKEVDELDQEKPSFSLGQEEAEEFSSELWHAGHRPKEAEGSAGALSATTNHLKDMQKIAFMLLEKKE